MTGLPQKLAVVAALLVAFLLVVGGAAPAVAHGSHPHPHNPTVERHQIALPSQPSEVSRASAKRDVQPHAASKSNIPRQAPNKSGDTDCCCGSLMCHAGVTLPGALMSHPFASSERVVPEPSSSVEGRAPSGLERPPRRPHSV